MILNSIYVYQYHLLEKNLTKNSNNNPNFEIYICKLSIFLTNIINVMLIHYKKNNCRKIIHVTIVWSGAQFAFTHCSFPHVFAFHGLTTH